MNVPGNDRRAILVLAIIIFLLNFGKVFLTSYFERDVIETRKIPQVVKHEVLDQYDAVKLKCNVLKRSFHKNRCFSVSELRWEFKKCGYGLHLVNCGNFNNLTWKPVLCKNGSKLCDGSTLKIENPKISDSGYYRCLYKKYISKQFKVHKVFHLEIYDPLQNIEILDEPFGYNNQTIFVNDEVTFRCRAKSLSPLHMVWMKLMPEINNDSTNSNHLFKYNNRSYQLIGNTTTHHLGNNLFVTKLTLNNCQIHDAGYYFCVVIGVHNHQFLKNKRVSLMVEPRLANKDEMLMTMDALDTETYFELGKLVETLTHSGLRTLDEQIFKEVKRKCKMSSHCVEKVYSLILYQMKKRHSEIRLLAFQMCIELFKRSAIFRELVVKDLRIIMELVVETNAKKKLPPPKVVAEILQSLGISTIKSWVEEFGETYKEVKIAYNYLRHVKKLNVQLLNTNNTADSERHRHLQEIQKAKLKAVVDEIDSNQNDIESVVTTLSSCISLLIPAPNDFFVNEIPIPEACTSRDTEDLNDPDREKFENEPDEINLKHFGIMSNYNITIDVSSVEEKLTILKSEENSSVIQNAEDSLKLLKNKFLPLIKKWNSCCGKFNAVDSSCIIKRVLDLKEKVEKTIRKYEEINIKKGNNDEADDCDDEFEEVIKEHYESDVENPEDFEIVHPTCTRGKTEETSWNISVGEAEDPTCALSTIKSLQQNVIGNSSSSTQYMTDKVSPEDNVDKSGMKSRKSKLLVSAPKIPFDIDLYHWEDENLTAPTLLSAKMGIPKFWGTVSEDLDEIPNPEGAAALRTRVIEFSGKFEPVKWSCRAPMPNGKLCTRMDRFKCPFHGKIVPRDENGVRQDQSQSKPCTSVLDENRSEADWKNSEFLEDIKNATGIDLTISKKNVKEIKKYKANKTHKAMKTGSSSLKEIEKRKFPGLTDVLGKQNNAYKRISKKIFNRRSLKKVNSALNKTEFIRHRDKFGDQFNYVYET